jgi:uncharacterized protein YkwD
MARHVLLLSSFLLASVGCTADLSLSDGQGGACVVTGTSVCGAPSMGAILPFQMTGSTEDGSSSYQVDRDVFTECRRTGAGAPDAAFQWTAPRAGTYDFSTIGSNFDTYLYLIRSRRGDSCEDVLACNDNSLAGRAAAELQIELEACETVTVVVDGAQPSSAGEFAIEITGREELCDEGIDDDGDGDVDCADRDCIFDVACRPGGTVPGDNPSNPNPIASGGGVAPTELELLVLELVNLRRAEGAICGDQAFPPAPPVAPEPFLTEAARLHSQDMADQRYFSHDGLDGRSPFDRMRDIGFRGDGPLGENIAAGQQTPETVMEAWMNSPGHCSNIMNPAFGVLGVGYVQAPGSPFFHYWTQNFGGTATP